METPWRVAAIPSIPSHLEFESFGCKLEGSIVCLEGESSRWQRQQQQQRVGGPDRRRRPPVGLVLQQVSPLGTCPLGRAGLASRALWVPGRLSVCPRRDNVPLPGPICSPCGRVPALTSRHMTSAVSRRRPVQQRRVRQLQVGHIAGQKHVHLHQTHARQLHTGSSPWPLAGVRRGWSRLTGLCRLRRAGGGPMPSPAPGHAQALSRVHLA